VISGVLLIGGIAYFCYVKKNINLKKNPKKIRNLFNNHLWKWNEIIIIMEIDNIF
jgi:hypothetical protein